MKQTEQQRIYNRIQEFTTTYASSLYTLVRQHYPRLYVCLIGIPQSLAPLWRHEGVRVALCPHQSSLPDPAAIVAQAHHVDATIVVVANATRTCLYKQLDQWTRILSAALSNCQLPWIMTEWSTNDRLETALLDACTGYTARMNQLAYTIQQALNSTQTVDIYTATGTTLKLYLDQRKVYIEDNFSMFCEKECQFPGGEVFVAPLEYCATGVIVVPVSSFNITSLHPDARIYIERGCITGCAIGKDALATQQLEHLLLPGEALCEFGIGINTGVKADYSYPWIEKAFSTIHIGFGENIHFGGIHTSTVHFDITITNPIVYLDGLPWVPQI